MSSRIKFFKAHGPMMFLVCASAVCARLLFAGCSVPDGGKVQRCFDMVEHLMNDSAGQAYAILKEIDSVFEIQAERYCADTCTCCFCVLSLLSCSWYI